MESRHFCYRERLAKPVACIMTALFLSPLFLSATFAQEKVDALPTRDMIEERYKWKLEDVFASDELWEQEFTRARNLLPEYAQYKGRLGESGDNLLDCLQLDNRVGEMLGKLSWYASRRNDENTAEQMHQAQRDRISSLYSEAGQASAFIGPEITAIPEARLWEFVEKTQGLKIFRHYFEDLQRSKAHILPPEQEELLAMAGEVTRSPAAIFSMFDNADIKFPAIVDEDGNRVEVTKGRFFGFLQSADRRVRMDAFNAMYTEYNK